MVFHRSVDRPIRNITKLFHLDDTCLMDDINDVHNLAKKVLETDKISYEESFDDQEIKFNDNNDAHDNNDALAQDNLDDTVPQSTTDKAKA